MEAGRSSTTMDSSNGVTKRRQRFSESSHGQVVRVRDGSEKKERDQESVNGSKRRRSERFPPRKERDVEDEDDVKHNNDRKSFTSGRIPDGMIGVPVPRKARSACIKRSYDCRTSSGSGGGGFREVRRRHPTSPGSEVVSPSFSTVKNVKGPKAGIPKPPKSASDDLEIEIAEVLSGLKQHRTQLAHRSKREDDSENLLQSSEVECAKTKLKTEAGGDSSAGCKNTMEAGQSTNTTLSIVPDIHKQETPSLLDQRQVSLDSAVSKGLLEGPQLDSNRDHSNCTSKLEIDLMAPSTIPSSPETLSLLPFPSDSIASKDYCKQNRSVKSKDKIIVQKRECLNLDLERLSQETSGKDSSLRLQNLDWTQPQQAKPAQQTSVLPLAVAVGGWSSRLPHHGYVPMIQNGKPVDGGSYTFVQPRPKRCATHVFIARNIQLHQHFVKANHIPQPNKASVYLEGGDLMPAAENPSLVGSPPILSLNSQAQDRFTVNVSATKDKAYQSGHFASTRQKKPQLPPTSSSIVPAQAFIFPTNHHLQPVTLPSKPSRSTNNNPCVGVGTASVTFNHLSSSASEASSPYFTVLPNNAYTFQPSSTIRGGSPTQVLPFFNGSFYSQQMFQPPQLLQKQGEGQRDSKATTSPSPHRQPQPQSVNSVTSQANVQKHRQQSQKSEAKAAGDNPDSRCSHMQKGGPYGQIITTPMQPQNFSMSFASFAGGSPPANLNFSSNGYQFVSAAPVHQENHQASDSKTGNGSCSSHAEDLKKTLSGRTPAFNGQTLVFDNPSRTLNFVSGTWPPPADTTKNEDPTVFPHHFTQRQQQSGRSKVMTHSQTDFMTTTSSQWKKPATSSLTSCNSLNIKQFQSQQRIRTHGQTQISFAAPSKSQQGRSGGGSSSSSAVTGSAPHRKAANLKVNNSKGLPLSHVPPSAAHAEDQAENSASASTQKTSPVCGRNVPPIINSCPGHLSELKY